MSFSQCSIFLSSCFSNTTWLSTTLSWCFFLMVYDSVVSPFFSSLLLPILLFTITSIYSVCCSVFYLFYPSTNFSLLWATLTGLQAAQPLTCEQVVVVIPLPVPKQREFIWFSLSLSLFLSLCFWIRLYWFATHSHGMYQMVPSMPNLI